MTGTPFERATIEVLFELPREMELIREPALLCRLRDGKPGVHQHIGRNLQPPFVEMANGCRTPIDPAYSQ